MSTRDRSRCAARVRGRPPSGSPPRSSARGIDVVFGGGNVGLMKVVADTTLAAGGEVIGDASPKR